jgi:hypothetical protein
MTSSGTTIALQSGIHAAAVVAVAIHAPEGA